MATITPPARAQNMGEYQRRVRSPLHRLRGYIRTYVSLEGALLLVLCLALWFWVGLVLDYGVFKATALDWVQASPWAVRLVLLVVVSGGIAAAVAFHVVGRLFRDFSDPALALVLERRFPDQLGDRLITAVELSDLRRAEEQGYSPAMILETVHEASERVEKVPVQKAFHWGRLIRRGVLAAVLTLGLYLLAGGLFLTLDLVGRVQAGRTGFGRFNEVAEIWFERNILLQNTIWPRRAQVEFANVPEGGLRVGQGNPIPAVKLRALEYVIADPKTPEGWRALTWNDLMTRPELIGGDVPAAFALTPRNPAAGATVDDVAVALRKLDVRNAPGDKDAAGRWQAADAAGWRPLLWADLGAEKLGGLATPKPQADWKPTDPAVGLTVEDVRAILANHQEEDKALDATAKALAQLEDLAATATGQEKGARVRAVKDGTAVKWQAADPATPGGWRPLVWADLADMAGVSAAPVPAEWATAPPLPAVGTSAVGLMVSPFGQASALIAGRIHEPRLGPTVDDVCSALDARRQAHEDRRAADVILIHLAGMADAHDVMERVNARAALPEMSRTMRRLDVPQKIVLTSTGARSSQRLELPRGSENDYSAEFKNLTESITFLVQADDYSTPRRSITLVPPPSLDKLEVAEARPAYLYYRPDDVTTLASLRGQKQPFARRDVHQAGTEFERIDVPAGTDLVLAGHVTKDLTEVFLKAKNPQDLPELRIRIDDVKKLVDAGLKVERSADDPRLVVVRPAKSGDAIRMPLAVGPDHRGFQIEFPDVRRDLVFDLEFTDADTVKGKREVRILPQGDTAPDLKEVGVAAIRNATRITAKGEKKTFFMVTAKARIPLAARISDDHALGEIVYRYTLTPVAAAGPAGDLPEGPNREVFSYAPPKFAQIVQDARDRLPSATVKDLRAHPQQPPFRQLVRDIEVKPDTWAIVQEDPLAYDFPLWQQPVTLDDNKPFYRMDFWMEASDLDADDEAAAAAPQPHLSKSKETFTFLVVREPVLMAEIGQDEAKQYGALHKRFQELGRLVLDKREFDDLTQTEREPGRPTSLDDTMEDVAALTSALAKLNDPDVKVSDLVAQSVRAGNINEALDKVLATTRDPVVKKYEDLVREEQLNVVNKEVIDYTQKNIVEKLHDLLTVNGDFAQAEDALARFRKALDDKGAMSDKERIDAAREASKDLKPKMTTLMKDLYAVLESMRGRENLQSLKDRLNGIDTGVVQLRNDTKRIQEILESTIFDKP